MRILCIAEACNPAWTSVPLVGYNFVRSLSDQAGVHITLATHIRNRAELEKDGLPARVPTHYIDNEWLARPLYELAKLLRGGKTLSWTTDTALAWPSYMVFEHTVRRQLRKQFRHHDFDLIHRITPLTPALGSPLAELTDIPMLIGPLNGGLPWPRMYPELRRKEKEWLVPLRNAYRALPYYRSTYQHIAGVIAGSRHTATEVPRGFRGRRFYLPENGVDPDRFPVASAWPEPRGRFRFITVGRLVPYKAMDIVLEALGRSKALRDCELAIVGDGPMRPQLEAFVRSHGMQNQVQFVGWVEQKQIAAEMARSQAFVFPSLREFGGGVVLEALASGLPSIVVDYGGPGELVTPECGILLPLVRREELVEQGRRAMEELSGDAERCRRLGTAACRRVREEFVWSRKAARLVEMYRQICYEPEASATAFRKPVANASGS